MDHPRRDIIFQPFLAFALNVLTTPTPLLAPGQQSGISAQYDVMILSVPTSAPRIILMGGQNVSVAAVNGLELKPGVPQKIGINNERQLYEVQGPLIDQFCKPPDSVPLVVWDVANIYFITTVAPQLMGVLLFKVPFV